MNKYTTAFICHSCKWSGNAITFLSEHQGVTPLKALRWLREAYGSDFRDTNSMKAELERILEGVVLSVIPPNEPIEVPEFFDPIEGEGWIGWEYLKSRGMDGLSEDWCFYYDPISDRIAIGVHDEHGRLVGFKARDYTGDYHPKYLILGDRDDSGQYGFKPYLASQIVFGIHRVKSDRLVLCEGEFDAIALQSAGFDGVATGSRVSDIQERIILDRAQEVILFYDSDAAGINATEIAIEVFEPSISVKIVPEHDGDPADMPTDRLNELIAAAEPSVLYQLTSIKS